MQKGENGKRRKKEYGDVHQTEEDTVREDEGARAKVSRGTMLNIQWVRVFTGCAPA